MTSQLLPLLQSGDRARLASALAESVQFHSPVADYQLRGDVSHLLAHIAAVLDDVEATREVADGTSTTTFVTATVHGRPLDGVLDERVDETGLVVEAKLLLRPFANLRVAIAAMGDALEAAPLPSMLQRLAHRDEISDEVRSVGP
jgi:hypothetical protein